mmetsp:Transcript_9436/g.25110  ORF Transcript_9436/g.25110 Transcript_9436/m.25110 type:complete len:277 (-) Transcript_9436:795-1625(-)
MSHVSLRREIFLESQSIMTSTSDRTMKRFLRLYRARTERTRRWTLLLSIAKKFSGLSSAVSNAKRVRNCHSVVSSNSVLLVCALLRLTTIWHSRNEVRQRCRAFSFKSAQLAFWYLKTNQWTSATHLKALDLICSIWNSTSPISMCGRNYHFCRNEKHRSVRCFLTSTSRRYLRLCLPTLMISALILTFTRHLLRGVSRKFQTHLACDFLLCATEIDVLLKCYLRSSLPCAQFARSITTLARSSVALCTLQSTTFRSIECFQLQPHLRARPRHKVP